MKNKMFTLLLFSFCMGVTTLKGQEKKHVHSAECGTTLKDDSNKTYQKNADARWQQNRNYYEDLAKRFLNGTQKGFANVRQVPVQLHIIQNTDGTGGIDSADLMIALNLVNEYYISGGLQIYKCGNINYIKDNTYSNYNKTEKAALNTAHSVANKMNVYVADIVMSGSSSICGHAEFPGGLDFVMLQTDCAKNGSTFAHEVGHYFNLYHTHQSGNELVNGSNCSVAGDLLCDTPADPSLSNKVSAGGCTVSGLGNDSNGDAYAPSTINIMSYATKECRVDFTTSQYARMLDCVDNDRSYLTCANSLEAGFYSYAAQSCGASLSVDFTDISLGGINSWTWDFGDGGTSTAKSPTHVYTTDGTYDVSLTVGDGVTTNVITKNYLVGVGAVDIPYTQDFETGVAALGRFKDTMTYKQNLEVSATAAESGSYGLLFEGSAIATTSPSFTTPSTTTAFSDLWNTYYKSSAYLCVDATYASDLTLSFDLKQMYRYNSNYSNFRVTIDGTQVALYQPSSDASEVWSTKTIDLTAYVGAIITIGFEGSHKYLNVDNATFIDDISITGTVVPVELLSFDANIAGTRVVLDWSTASEINNSHFEVERSQDGERFEKIGTIKGNGNSFEINNYTFLDKTPHQGTNYYRLKQVDFDGAFEYTDTRLVVMETISSKVTVYPNPFDQNITIDYSAFREKVEDLELYNLNGQYIQNISINENDLVRFNTTHLPNGVYILKINQIYPIRIVKTQ